MNEKTASSILTFIGFALLLIGIVAAFYGPLEIYCYYLFSEGGPFHYEGFGFGSLMFGSITLQIFGYYAIAWVFLPLGFGHLKKQRWIRNVAVSLLYGWFITGIPILLMVLWIFISTKKPSLPALWLSVVISFLLYTAIPALLIKFYKTKSVPLVLKQKGSALNTLGNLPIPVLMMVFIEVAYFFVFHMLLFFRGIFPFFGHWLINLRGFYVNSASILLFISLIIGTVKLSRWAWRVLTAYSALFTGSLLITLYRTGIPKLIELLHFPQKEADALMNIPLKGFHLCFIIGIPLLVSLGVIVHSRRYFQSWHETRLPGNEFGKLRNPQEKN